VSTATFPQQPLTPQAPKPGIPRRPHAAVTLAGPAWASFALGVLGTLTASIAYANDVTAIAAMVGALLGVFALFGTKKRVAGAGIALCVTAVAFTMMVELDSGSGIFGADKKAATAQPVQSTSDAVRNQLITRDPTWGQRYTWAGGLAVTVSAPVDCAPSSSSSPDDIARASRVTVTVINRTGQPFDAGMFAVGSDAQFNGHRADAVVDSGGDCGEGIPTSAIVPPGQTFSYDIAYAVDPQPGELRIALQPGYGEDRTTFTGRG
jgi:hypothetical protein